MTPDANGNAPGSGGSAGVALLCGKYGAKEDERLLLKTLQSMDRPHVREIVGQLGINENRAAYICEKWAGRGWYGYGVNVLAGWLEGEGLTAA